MSSLACFFLQNWRVLVPGGPNVWIEEHPRWGHLFVPDVNHARQCVRRTRLGPCAWECESRVLATSSAEAGHLSSRRRRSLTKCRTSSEQDWALLVPSTPNEGFLEQPSNSHSLVLRFTMPTGACRLQKSRLPLPGSPYEGCVLQVG